MSQLQRTLRGGGSTYNQPRVCRSCGKEQHYNVQLRYELCPACFTKRQPLCRKHDKTKVMLPSRAGDGTFFCSAKDATGYCDSVVSIYEERP